MNIFFVTDNKPWFEFLNTWRKGRSEQILIYCSTAGSANFYKEIKQNSISIIDIKSNSETLKDNFDMGFSCHCKQIFPKDLVEKIPCFNFHPGFNPYNRGWFPQVFSIINGKPAGATLHKMDHEIDHGPIIDQIKVNISEQDTSKSVYDRILTKEFELFEKWIERILKNNYTEKKPDIIGNYNSITDFKSLCEIDPEKTVTFKEAIDYFRAMTFDGYDNAFFYDQNGRKIYINITLTVK